MHSVQLERFSLFHFINIVQDFFQVIQLMLLVYSLSETVC